MGNSKSKPIHNRSCGHQIVCDGCNKELNTKYIKCFDCLNKDICLKCFLKTDLQIVGHTNNHKVKMIKTCQDVLDLEREQAKLKQTREKSKCRGPNRLSDTLEKPVIYFYSNLNQELTISLSLHHNQFSTVYPGPQYMNNNRQLLTWMITPHDTVPYRFWDANFDRNSFQWDLHHRTTILERKDYTDYLESACENFGFILQEKYDFITYWLPQMNQFPANKCRIELTTTTADKYSTLQLRDSSRSTATINALIVRINIHIGAVSNDTQTTKKSDWLKYSSLLNERDKHDVVLFEWGGGVIVE